MDFFQHQAKARSRTVLLVFLYCLGLIGLSVVLVVGIVAGCAATEVKPTPEMLLLCIGGVLVLVIGGSLFKTAQLSQGGGRVIAESLGGRQVFPSSTDPADRRLHNVVEEMALAAGIPVPALYIMDNEKSINAFAAGFSPNAAVIGVNRGTVDLLTRDELQGVIAHEFSHILNGDMRMNLRLIGILFGLQLIAIVGYYAMRTVYFIPSNRNNKGGGAAIFAILGVGLVLMVVGYIGIFFSALIQAAISRQREFLADASAVQFTRNPDGIAGALKKIGTPGIGSNLNHANAAESSHLFFGNACGFFSLGNLLATHPDLATRIRRIDPQFDGRFPKPSEVKPLHSSHFVREFSQKKGSMQPHKAERINAQQTTMSRETVLEHIGKLTVADIAAAGAMFQEIPKHVAVLADNPLTAQAVFFAMLLDADEAIRHRQLNHIQTAGSEYLMKETLRLQPQMSALPEHEKILLAQHVSASLREMVAPQFQQFSKVLDLLISADKTMDLFEYTIKAMLLRDLDIYFGLARQLRAKYTTLSQVRVPVRAVLSYLAYAGHSEQEIAQNAFSAAMKELGLSEAMLLPVETTTMQFDRSLRILAETVPALKKQIFSALMICVGHDGVITSKEAGLVRAIAAMLAIPIPVLS